MIQNACWPHLWAAVKTWQYYFNCCKEHRWWQWSHWYSSVAWRNTWGTDHICRWFLKDVEDTDLKNSGPQFSQKTSTRIKKTKGNLEIWGKLSWQILPKTVRLSTRMKLWLLIGQQISMHSYNLHCCFILQDQWEWWFTNWHLLCYFGHKITHIRSEYI